MGDINAGFSFSGNTPNNQVTAANLNALVGSAVVNPSLISGKSTKAAPATTDAVLLLDNSQDPPALVQTSVQQLVPSISCGSGARGVTIVNVGATSTTQLVVRAAEVVMLNASMVPRRVASFNVSALDITQYVGGSTANGRDFATLTGPEWVYIWAISDGVNDRALFSLSSSAPTLPTGFTFSTLIGTWRVTAISNALIIGVQNGKGVAFFNPHGGDTTSTNQVPFILGGAQFSAAQVSGTAKQFTAIDLTKCIPTGIVAKVKGVVGYSTGGVSTYAIASTISGTVAMDSTTISPNEGLSGGVAVLGANGIFGFLGMFSFEVPVVINQQIWCAVDNTGTRHDMRITGFTLNF